MTTPAELRIDTSQLPTPAQKMLAPNSPAPLRMMGAKGIVPGLKPDALLTLVCAFATCDERPGTD